ncbi:MAG: NAD(P)/FAD-dependent oxidoreductase [Candidatus Methylacidiphilales bacterium]|nr:NAD(P)/FAD-dependent oxidoreductase [Candidatus Methylacidiphilales bacterium]
MATVPRVVVVGGGFGGLSVVRALRNAPVQVIFIDKSNHHLFQPLLYQVATATLGPAEIATPLRQLVAKQKNVMLGLAELSGVDTVKRQILVNYLGKTDARFDFDYLVLATGATHNYFGHNEFAKFAPGLKRVGDAISVRDRILRVFEMAEMEDEPKKHQDLLTFVLVGGGPTGVELAGAIAELRRYTLASEYRRVDPQSAKVILLQSGDRILPSFHEDLSKAAHARLERLGVEVQTGVKVTGVDEAGVDTSTGRIASRTVIWTAGVTPSPAGKWLGSATDKAGRVMVNRNCEVEGQPGIFAVGDTACFETDGGPLPGVAQVALQQGNHVGAVIAARVSGNPEPEPFRYKDKGNMAVVGRNFAVIEIGGYRSAGFFAWLIWAFIHVVYLAATGNRLRVITQWIWSYLTFQRGSRLIVDAKDKAPRPTS